MVTQGKVMHGYTVLERDVPAELQAEANGASEIRWSFAEVVGGWMASFSVRDSYPSKTIRLKRGGTRTWKTLDNALMWAREQTHDAGFSAPDAEYSIEVRIECDEL